MPSRYLRTRRAATADPARTLEVRNILPNRPPNHHVLDKYQRAPGVENEDAATFSGGPDDLIVSVSTLEQSGTTRAREQDKAAQTVRDLLGLTRTRRNDARNNPVGYNHDLDDATGGALGGSVSYLLRLKWLEGNRSEPSERE